jgi:hypothetical protein
MSVFCYKFSAELGPGIKYTKRLFITIAVVLEIGFGNGAIGNQIFVSVSKASQ